MFKTILPNGSLRTKAILARVGVQSYNNGTGVYRPEEEVRRSAEGFTGMTITFVHPKEGEVNADNIAETAVGTILDSYYQDETGLVIGDIVIFDPEVVQKVLDKQYYISLGYRCHLEKSEGIWIDEGNLSRTGVKEHPYEYIQRNIVANHAAIVDNPRAGEIAKIFTDSTNDEKSDSNNTIFRETINDFSMDINELLSKLMVAMDAMQTHMNDMGHKMADMQMKLDSMDYSKKEEAMADSADNNEFANIMGKLVEAKIVDSSYANCDSLRALNVQIAQKLLPSIQITDSMSDDFIAGLIAAKAQLTNDAPKAVQTPMSTALNNQEKKVADSSDEWSFQVKRG